MQFMIKFLKRPIVIISFVILAGGIIGGYAYFGGDKAQTYDFVVVKKRNLIQEVSVTGHVKPAKSVNLAFEKAGKVSRVYADVGNKVGIGQTLVVLENAETIAQLAQAEAALEKDQAKLAELKRGTRPEEIQVQEVKVANAKTALEDAKKNLVDKLQDAYTKSDDAIRGRADQMFTNPQTQNPQLKLWGVDSNLVEWRRLLLESNVFPKWKTSLNFLTAQSDLTQYIYETKKYLDEVKIFLDKLFLIVNNPNTLYVVNGTGQEIPSSWKTDVATARTNINTAISNLTSAEEKLKTAGSSLTLAEQELTLKKAGTIEEQIVAQEAQIKSASANADYYRAQLAKTIIRSPISGVVTTQNAKVGEIVSANTSIVSLISASQFEIEANMPEADIAKVSVGNTSLVTLDAYGRDVVFKAKVVAVDPAETIVNGVATYKVTFQFVKNDERVKSGMTANIDIASASRENVIAVSQRAIIRKNGDQFVRIVDGESFKEVKVETGLRGSDGNIEIISGVNEGDKVITFSEE